MKKYFLLLLLIFIGASEVPAQRLESKLSALNRLTHPLYRKATKEELRKIAPNPHLFQKYAAFLRQDETGLTRLLPDAGCAESTRVVVATKECLAYTMPGAGYAYSFREDNYRIPRLADIIFTENSFQASGVLLHGIFVKLGDVPLETVGLQTAGMKYLVDFQPEPNYDRAKLISEKLSEGVETDGFFYRRGLNAEDDTVYALRSIAYRGRYLRAIRGITYNEFAYDKRRDIIVAFRIVERGADDSVTILWKILSEKKSPKIKGRVKDPDYNGREL